MKAMILVLALAGNCAHAAICGVNIQCGTFFAEDPTGGHTVTRQYSFTELTGDEVQFEMATIDNGVKTASQEIFKFDANGFVTILKNGKRVGTGVCLENRCSISTPPFLFKGEIGSQGLIFRFTANSMQLAKLYVGVDGKTLHTTADFAKLP